MAQLQARKRIILILQLLYENSDEENPLTTNHTHHMQTL